MPGSRHPALSTPSPVSKASPTRGRGRVPRVQCHVSPSRRFPVTRSQTPLIPPCLAEAALADDASPRARTLRSPNGQPWWRGPPRGARASHPARPSPRKRAPRGPHFSTKTPGPGLPLTPPPRFPTGRSSPKSRTVSFLPAVTSPSPQPRHLGPHGGGSSSCEPCAPAGSRRCGGGRGRTLF